MDTEETLPRHKKQQTTGILLQPDSLESLVQVVKRAESIYGEKSGETVYVKSPGIFQLVIPAELVEDTLNELLPLLGDGDIIIDHGNSNFKDSRRRAERLEKLGIQYLDCGTSGGVYGLERGYCLMVGGASGRSICLCPHFQGTRTWHYRCTPHRHIYSRNQC